MFRRIIFDAFSAAFLLSSLTVALFVKHEGQLLNLTQDLLYVILFLLIGAGVSAVLTKMKVTTLGGLLFNHQTQESHAWYRSFWGWQLLVTLAVAFLVSLAKTEFSFVELLDQPEVVDAPAEAEQAA